MSRIGELLVREKMLSLQQLQQAQDEAKRTGKRLGATLARLGYVDDQKLTSFVAKQYSLPSVNLSEVEIDPAVADAAESLVERQVRSGLVVRMAVLYDLLTQGPVEVKVAEIEEVA